jgi:hypothetical protein
MNSSTVLVWGLLLAGLASFFLYRQELLDVFWNQPSDTSNHLFTKNPVEYAADTTGKAIGSGIGSAASSLF